MLRQRVATLPCCSQVVIAGFIFNTLFQTTSQCQEKNFLLLQASDLLLLKASMEFFPMVAQLLKALLELETDQIRDLLQEHCIEAEWIKSEVMNDGIADGKLLQDFLHGQSTADGSKDLSEE